MPVTRCFSPFLSSLILNLNINKGFYLKISIFGHTKTFTFWRQYNLLWTEYKMLTFILIFSFCLCLSVSLQRQVRLSALITAHLHNNMMFFYKISPDVKGDIYTSNITYCWETSVLDYQSSQYLHC